MKRIKIILIILYIILGQNSIVFAQPDENTVENATVAAVIDENGTITPPQLLSEGAVLMDAKTGEVLFEKNMNQRLYPASTTKVMTAMLALENSKLEDTVFFSAENVTSFDSSSSSIGMKPGEILTMEQALNGLMIASANEVAKGIAESISGSEDEFAKKMNERAVETGALNTNFTNSHGLHDDQHYTTPYDLALMFKQALEYPYFRQLICTLSYVIPETNITDEERPLVSRNKILLKNSGYYYEPCGGGKTGFTDQSAYTLVTYGEKNGMSLIAAVMKAPFNGTYTDSIALYNYGFDFFKNEELFNSGGYRKDVPVVQSYKDEEIDRGSVVVLAQNSISKILRQDILDKDFGYKEILPEKLKAPIKEGDVVGKLEVYYRAEKYGETDLLAFFDVAELSQDEIRDMKKEEIIVETKDKLPILLTFVPVIILLIWLLISAVLRYKKIKKSKNMFATKKQYKMK